MPELQRGDGNTDYERTSHLGLSNVGWGSYFYGQNCGTGSSEGGRYVENASKNDRFPKG
jgi:hypothetical protein